MAGPSAVPRSWLWGFGVGFGGSLDAALEFTQMAPGEGQEVSRERELAVICGDWMILVQHTYLASSMA